VTTRLRLQVEALENRLVPSSSKLGSLLLPPAAPSAQVGLASEIKTETKVAATPVAHKKEVGSVSEIKSETKVAMTPVAHKKEIATGSVIKDETQKSPLATKAKNKAPS
jgi:hypothetical protein